MKNIILYLCLLTTNVLCQEIIKIGNGSFASFPPSQAGETAKDMLQKKIYINDKSTPVPTNDWWTQLLVNNKGGKLLFYPGYLSVTENNLELFYPTEYNKNGTGLIEEHPIIINSNPPVKYKEVIGWTDWTVTFRMEAENKSYMDITVGRGMPTIWIKYNGLVPLVSLKNKSVFFNSKGEIINSPATGGVNGLEYGNHNYGIFTSDKSILTKIGNNIEINESTFIAVSLLPQKENISFFQRYSFAVPTECIMSWDYSSITGKVKTEWLIKTELLQGAEHKIIQGWLPHHYRNTGNNINFNNIEYISPRGKIKCAADNKFEIIYSFAGVSPSLPAPVNTANISPFNKKIMAKYLEEVSNKDNYGGDTYWGGKDILTFTNMMTVAKNLNDASYQKIKQKSIKSLTDWLSYTPGEKSHYFARYDNWKALIGFNESYGSAEFSDNHFHYGYFTLSSALLAMDDADFLKEYGEMSKMIAKQYANWDRKDKSFPYMRTFDIWEGHSWAGGFSSTGGNNQESSSEAMQSWAGLFLLGTALNDKDMIAAGAMGYSIEAEATMEYWFNKYGDNWPKQYSNPIMSMIWGGGGVYATYFSDDPSWKFGIQWLPAGSDLNYLISDNKFANKIFDIYLLELEKKNINFKDVTRNGDLGNVILGYMQYIKPDETAKIYDEMIQANENTAKMSGMIYYLTHAGRDLGEYKSDLHTSLPSSAVYYHPLRKEYSYIGYNPNNYPAPLDIFDNDKIIGTYGVLPRNHFRISDKVKSVTSEILIKYPIEDDINFSVKSEEFYIVTKKELTDLPLAITDDDGNKYLTEKLDDKRIIRLKLQYKLLPKKDYLITFTKNQIANENITFNFRTSAFRNFIITDTVPGNKSEKNSIDTKEIRITFSDTPDEKSIRTLQISGKGATTISPQEIKDKTAIFYIGGKLEIGETYKIILPANSESIDKVKLSGNNEVSFSTIPPPCPPHIYTDIPCTGKYYAEKTLNVDMINIESPHNGKSAIKISGKGNLIFFAGEGDNGPDRKPINISKYSMIEFFIKGKSSEIWVKSGHPVFDKSFIQKRIDNLTDEYERYTINIPPKPKAKKKSTDNPEEPDSEVEFEEVPDYLNTLFMLSIPKDSYIYIDDIRFVE